MLVLAIDTSTAIAFAGLATVDGKTGATTAIQSGKSPGNQHAEELSTVIDSLFPSERGLSVADVDAIVVGVGPGPYTGLRVGVATAAALGDALGVPVHGVCSLDAVAAGPGGAGPAGTQVLVVSDAKRKEVYWACYRSGGRLLGPGVCRPEQLPSELGGFVPGTIVGPAAALLGGVVLPGAAPSRPGPEAQSGPETLGLIAAAAPGLLSRQAPPPLAPLYLRPPDAKPPKGIPA